MIVGFRAWGLRRRPTGRSLRRAVPRWSAEHLGWLAEAMPGCGHCETVTVVELETEEVLVGQAGAPSERAWEPGWTSAGCMFGHQPPHDHAPWPLGDPGCGFYVMREGIGSARPTVGASNQRFGRGCGCLMVGLAGLAGEVEEAERGFRGAEGKVLALLEPRAAHGADCPGCQGYQPDDDHRPADHLPGLVARYQVPVFASTEELAGYARRYTDRPIQARSVTEHDHQDLDGLVVDFHRSVRSATWASFSFSLPAAAPAARQLPLAPPAPPARRPPWWGRGGEPPWARNARVARNLPFRQNNPGRA